MTEVADGNAAPSGPRSRTATNAAVGQPESRSSTGTAYEGLITRELKVTLVVLVGVFVALLDAFIVNIALPAIRGDLQSELASLSWVVSAYAIVSAALVVPAGRWSDRVGRRRGFLGGLAVFVTASALCAAAPSLPVLIGARCAQAVGAAFMLPSSLGLLLAEYPPHRRPAAIGMWGAVGGVAAAAGPLVGAVLVQASWRWVFLVNLPIGLVTLALGWRVLRERRDPSGHRPDALGAALLALAVGALTSAVTKAPAWSWGGERVLALLGATVVLLAAFALRSRSHPAPVIEPALVRNRAVALANAANLLFHCSFAAMVLGGVLFLTAAWHHSILRAGLEIAPGPLAAALVAYPGAAIGQRFGHGRVGAAGALLFAVSGLWRLAFLRAGPHYASELLPAILLGGVATGFVLPTTSAAATVSLPPQRFATGSGMLGVTRGVGIALGVAILVAIVGDEPRTAQAFDGAWVLLIVAALAASGALAAIGQLPLRRGAPSPPSVAAEVAAEA
jgi:EmrB/QacA subfamily drug resistance transporter